MRKEKTTFVPPSALLVGLVLMCPPAHAGSFDYMGLCDASAAVALDEEHFVVADDETNTLRIYRRGKADAVEAEPDLSKVLDAVSTDKKGKDKVEEVDLEGAAVVDGRVYWIASHSAHKGARAGLFDEDRQ